MVHFVTHKYKDGVTVAAQWDIFYDGPWNSEQQDIEVEHDYNFYPE